MDSLEWHNRFINLSKEIATWSKDPSTKIGAVVVGPDQEIRSTGYNGFPRMVVSTPERWERSAKYNFIAHAEANAIYNAARIGVPLKDCTIYISSLLPCHNCAQAIIQAGIACVVVFNTEYPDRWAESIQTGLQMFEEAGVEVISLINLD